MTRIHARMTICIMVLGFMTSMTTFSASEASKIKPLPKKSPILGRVGGPGTLTALGIAGMECKCSFTISPDERFWIFQAEPKITGIDPDGPATGKLKAGDVIVAIDGMLITTRKAGLRFANIIPGEPIELTIRRGNRTIDETIVAGEISFGDELTIEGLDSTVTQSVRSLSKSIEALAELSALSAVLDLPEGFELLETLQLPGLPELLIDLQLPEIPELPEIPDFHTLEMFPAGWSGFGLSFSGQISNKSPEPAQWRFDSPPKIHSIEPGSPADRAGLKVGDIITHIDGVKLDSKRGGKRFSTVTPGQTVEWTIRRNGERQTVIMVAEERPESISSGMRKKTSWDPGFGAEPHELRYTGSLGETDIEVIGTSSVKVTVDKERGEIIIKSKDATIHLRKSEKKK